MTKHFDPLDLVFSALADHNRRQIINMLSKADRNVSALAAPLGISLPATLQHLGVLEEAGLIHSRKQGRVRSCTLDRDALSAAEVWIGQRRQLLSRQLDSLGAFLAENPEGNPSDKPT